MYCIDTLGKQIRRISSQSFVKRKEAHFSRVYGIKDEETDFINQPLEIGYVIC